MDAKLSCLITGIIGVIFGSLALLLPDVTRTTFSVMFWLLIVGGVAILFIIAITSTSDESMFWFGLSAVLLVIGAVSFFVPLVVEIIFVLILAGVAFYTGFSDITLASTFRKKTKYLIVMGMVIAAALLLAALIWYFPHVMKNPVLTVLGTLSLVFGLSSVLMGWYLCPEPVPSPSEEPQVHKGECFCHKPGEK